MRNGPEQLTSPHVPRALSPLYQNSGLRQYDWLFAKAHSDTGGKDFLQILNPDRLKVLTAYVEASLPPAQPNQKFQFEHFVTDRLDHLAGVKPMLNRETGLKDGWVK